MKDGSAWPSGCRQRGRVVRSVVFYDGHDRKVDGSTPTQASLLTPWIRCFMAVISAWRNLTSSKLKNSNAKFKRRKSETRATPKRVWIRPMHRSGYRKFWWRDGCNFELG